MDSPGRGLSTLCVKHAVSNMTKDSCQQNNCANTIEYDPIFQTDKLSNKKIKNNILTNNNSEKEKKNSEKHSLATQTQTVHLSNNALKFLCKVHKNCQLQSQFL